MIIDLLDTDRSTNRQLKVSLKSSATVIIGDSRKVLGVLPDNCVNCVITSPPYWGIRDYDTIGQIGLEPDLDEYIEALVIAFDEVRRVLRKDGTMWVNIGDAYSSGNRKYRTPDPKYAQRAMQTRPRTPPGLKPKDLLGIPWRIAFALQSAGWYFRTEIIWHKTNAMPESVRDRPARNHEYLFLFSKSQHYQFSREKLERHLPNGSRSIWSIAAGRSNFIGHHAVFPKNLVQPCMQATTRKNDLVLDPFCGTGTTGCVSMDLGRRFLGIELNPRYAKAAVSRLGNQTNLLSQVTVEASPSIDAPARTSQRSVSGG